MIIILFTLFVIIVVSILGIEEDLEFDRKKKEGSRRKPASFLSKLLYSIIYDV